jgi:hypothetical protein
MFEDLDLFLNGICVYWEKKITNTLEIVRGNFIGKHKTVRLLMSVRNSLLLKNKTTLYLGWSHRTWLWVKRRVSYPSRARGFINAFHDVLTRFVQLFSYLCVNFWFVCLRPVVFFASWIFHSWSPLRFSLKFMHIKPKAKHKFAWTV